MGGVVVGLDLREWDGVGGWGAGRMVEASGLYHSAAE